MPEPTRLDGELAAAARSGDERAFGTLVKRHYSTVYAVSLAGTGLWSAAEDVTQDTFLLAWRNIGRLRNPAAITAWLRKIARNLASNWRRSDAYRRRLAEVYQHEQPASTGHEESNPMIETSEQLDAALEAIPKSAREVVVLYYIQSRSIRETAEALGISENAVKKRLQRGRALLRDRLEEAWLSQARSRATSKEHESRVGRVLAGLALGPAMPELGAHAAGSGWSLVAHRLVHEGASSALKHAFLGGATMTAKQVGVAGGILILLSLLFQFVYSVNKVHQPSGLDGTDEVAIATNDRIRTDDDAGVPTTDAMLPTPLLNEPPLTSDSNAQPADTTDTADNRPASILGTVNDQWNQPVAGADVVLAIGPPSMMNTLLESSRLMSDPSRQHRTITDAAGAFEFSGLQQYGSIRLFAKSDEAQGGFVAGISPGQISTDITIKVKRGHSLFGKVLNASRRPVANALAVPLAVSFGGGGVSGGMDSEAVLTNAAGEFEMISEWNGEVALHISSMHDGEAIFTNIPNGTDEVVELLLPRPTSIYGRIIYGDNNPASGLRVALEGQFTMTSDGGSSLSGSGAGYVVRTDAEGRYRVEGVAVSVRYNAQVLDGERELSLKTPLGTVGPGADLEWNYAIEELVVIRGSVRGESSGKGIAGASVYLISDGNVKRDTETKTDAEGNFEWRLPLKGGTYGLMPCYAYVTPTNEIQLSRTDVEIRPGSEIAVSLTLPDPYEISLEVTDARGKPVPEATISAYWLWNNGMYGSGPSLTTDEAGKFTWNGFGPLGAYEFQVLKSGYVTSKTLPFTGASGEAFFDTVRLYEEASIDGFVVDGSGDPVQDAQLSFIVRLPDGEKYDAYSEAVTAADGYFILENKLPAATVDLEIVVRQSPGNSPNSWRADSVNLEPHSISSLGQIVIAPLDASNR